jgi:hypothetical protein
VTVEVPALLAQHEPALAAMIVRAGQSDWRAAAWLLEDERNEHDVPHTYLLPPPAMTGTRPNESSTLKRAVLTRR